MTELRTTLHMDVRTYLVASRAVEEASASAIIGRGGG